MNCENAKDIILMQIYGRLKPEEKAQWDAHLKECPRCARMSRKLLAHHDILTEQTDIPLPDWEKSWDIISSRTFDETHHIRRNLPAFKWVTAAASLLVVFLLGYFLGRRFLLPPSAGPSSPRPYISSQAPLERYADSIESLLTGFVNRSDIIQPEEFSSVEKQLIVEMLTQTRLLKSFAQERRMSHLDALLGDLEFILLNLAHLHPEDRETARYLNRMIREKGLRFRLRDLASQEIGI